jgi:hypothetical protein
MSAHCKSSSIQPTPCFVSKKSWSSPFRGRIGVSLGQRSAGLVLVSVLGSKPKNKKLPGPKPKLKNKSLLGSGRKRARDPRNYKHRDQGSTTFTRTMTGITEKEVIETKSGLKTPGPAYLYSRQITYHLDNQTRFFVCARKKNPFRFRIKTFFLDCR